MVNSEIINEYVTELSVKYQVLCEKTAYILVLKEVLEAEKPTVQPEPVEDETPPD